MKKPLQNQQQENLNLERLINKIKSEAVEAAEMEAEKILLAAKNKAEEIIKNAEKTAAELEKSAKNRVEKETSSGENAIRLAARDMILHVQYALQQLLRNVLKQQVNDKLSGRFLEEILLRMLEFWAKESDKDAAYDFFLSEEDKKNLSEGLIETIKDQLGEGVEIRILPEIQSGFRLYSKDQEYYFDFTGEGISRILCELLNSKLAELVKLP